MMRVLRVLPLLLLFPACEELPASPDVPNEPPRPSFFFTPVAPIYSGQTTVAFNAQGSRDLDGQIVSYDWNFGDGTTRTTDEQLPHPRLHGHVRPLPERHLRSGPRGRGREGWAGHRLPERHRHRAAHPHFPGMRALRAAAAALLLGALSFPVSSGAAENRRNLPRHKLGPLYVKPRLRLASGIDTNVFQSFDDPTRDAVTIVSPRVDGMLPVGRRLWITGSGAADLFYYRRQDDERSLDFQGEGRAELHARAVTLFGGGGRRAVHAALLDRRGRPDQAPGEARLRGPHLAGHAEALGDRPGDGRGLHVRSRGVPAGRGHQAGPRPQHAQRNRPAALRPHEPHHAPRLRGGHRGPVLQPASELPPRARIAAATSAGFEFSGRGLLTGRLLAGRRVFPGTLADGTPPYEGPVVSADVALPRGPPRAPPRPRASATSSMRRASWRSRRSATGTPSSTSGCSGKPSSTSPSPSSAWPPAASSRRSTCSRYPYPDAFHLAMRVDHRYTGGLQPATGSSARRLRIGGHVLWARRVSNLPILSYEGRSLRPHRGDPSVSWRSSRSAGGSSCSPSTSSCSSWRTRRALLRARRPPSLPRGVGALRPDRPDRGGVDQGARVRPRRHLPRADALRDGSRPPGHRAQRHAREPGRLRPGPSSPGTAPTPEASSSSTGCSRSAWSRRRASPGASCGRASSAAPALARAPLKRVLIVGAGRAGRRPGQGPVDEPPPRGGGGGLRGRRPGQAEGDPPGPAHPRHDQGPRRRSPAGGRSTR